MAKGKKKRGIIWIVLVGIVVFGFIFRRPIAQLFEDKITTSNDKPIELYVIKAQGLSGLKQLLEEKEVIQSSFYFDRFAYLKDFDGDKIATGKYIIQPKTPIKDLINGFTENSLGNGNAEVEVQVTFNNCKTVGDMCGKVAKSLMIDSTTLADYILRSEILTKYGFTDEQFSAMFIPNTYNFFWDVSPEQFMERMAKEFRTFWNDSRKEKLKKIGLTSPSQAVTLASIVYAEQSVASSEWPIIARLYLNRIQQGILLQSDPTFKFCWGDQLNGVQILTYQHRAINCPYNTYLHKGLPPGPINMPPAGVVDAVLNPDNNNYLYMCAKPDYTFTHNFAKDYGTHQRNAAVYQKWIREEQKKKAA